MNRSIERKGALCTGVPDSCCSQAVCTNPEIQRKFVQPASENDTRYQFKKSSAPNVRSTLHGFPAFEHGKPNVMHILGSPPA